MSESLPYSGVEIVDVIRNAVVAQACSSKPWRSSAIVRVAVGMIVWSRAARNMPIIRPPRIVMICRWVEWAADRAPGAPGDPAAAGAEVLELLTRSPVLVRLGRCA